MDFLQWPLPNRPAMVTVPPIGAILLNHLELGEKQTSLPLAVAVAVAVALPATVCGCLDSLQLSSVVFKVCNCLVSL